MTAEGFVRRVTFAMAMVFFITVGWFLLAIVIPELWPSFLPIKHVPIQSRNTNTLLGLGGTMISLISIFGSISGSLLCKFDKRVITPKDVDALHAQNMVVFLVDQKIYETDLAKYYNLSDLTKLKIVEDLNFFGQRIDKDLIIDDDEITVTDLKDVSVTG
jgi:hypothetical protein